MLFRPKNAPAAGSPWQPFILRLKESFLIGKTGEGHCVECLRLWLSDRSLPSEVSAFSPKTVPWARAETLLRDVAAPNTMLEISAHDSVVRMECAVFPHPKCGCERTETTVGPRLEGESNLTFSPMTDVHCVRYGVPRGNLWMARVGGRTPLQGSHHAAFGTGEDRAQARTHAIEKWLKQAAYADIQATLSSGPAKEVPAVCLQTQRACGEEVLNPHTFQSIGVGADLEAATLDGLYGLAQARTLKRYCRAGKSPMLVVGTSSWVRDRLPFSFLERYDVHLLFFPQAMPCWIVGAIALSRTNVQEKPLISFSTHADVNIALERATLGLVESFREEQDDLQEYPPGRMKLHAWWTAWIYRCSKIQHGDLLSLEKYPTLLEGWRDLFRDGEPRVSIAAINTRELPAGHRVLVRLRLNEPEKTRGLVPAYGIATWLDFRSHLFP